MRPFYSAVRETGHNLCRAMKQLVVADSQVDHGVAMHRAADNIGACRDGVQHQLERKMGKHRFSSYTKRIALHDAFGFQPRGGRKGKDAKKGVR